MFSFLSLFFFPSHVMTIEVPAGLRSWLFSIVFVSWFLFLFLEPRTRLFFTFLILSLDLGVTCVFLDTNGFVMIRCVYFFLLVPS